MVDSPRTADGGRDRLLLLDGHSLAYRAFYALPVENFSTTTGQPTNAVYGFTSMLINVLRDEQPTHVAVAFDVSRSTFRTAEYADYKANRTKAPDEFHGQVSLVKEVLDALQIRYLEAENYEADDVLATMASRAAREGFEVLICTGDRDSFQLVDADTTILYVVARRLRVHAHDPGCGGRPLWHPAGALSRPCSTCRGVERQPARRARCRAQDGGQVAHDLRLAR